MSDFIAYKQNEGIWLHFLRHKNGQTAQCKVCKIIIKRTGGSTKGMHEHAKRVHDLSVLKRKTACADEESQATASKRSATGRSILSFMVHSNENSLPATLARMTASDGLPFRVFVTSSDLRRGLVALGLGKLPTSETQVKQLVMEEGERVRSFVTTEIASLKKQGHRFSVTFDEWTSTRNRRYMNVNVHA